MNMEPCTPLDTTGRVLGWSGGSDGHPFSMHHVEVEIFGAPLTSATECGIFHDIIDAVDMKPLPNSWFGDLAGARLPCKHTFHVSALALHFLTHNMTCPVCRRGDESIKMSSASLPEDICGAFEEHMRTFNIRNPPEHTQESTWINLYAIQTQFTLHLTVDGYHTTMWHRLMYNPSQNTISSRLLGLDVPSNRTESLTRAFTQHNFRRRLYSLRFGPGTANAPELSMVISHPCLPDDICIEGGRALFRGSDEIMARQAVTNSPESQATEREIDRVRHHNYNLTTMSMSVGRVIFDVVQIGSGSDTTLEIAEFQVLLNVDILTQLCITQLHDVIRIITGVDD